MRGFDATCGLDRRRAEHLAQLARGLGAAVLHVLDRIDLVPAGERVQGRGQRMPVGRAQRLVALAVRGVALAVADQQAFLQHPLQCGRWMHGQRARVDPLAGAERAEQFAFRGVDFDLLAAVRRQREPAAVAAQAVAAGQQHVQVEADFLARFQIQHRAATYPHNPPPSP